MKLKPDSWNDANGATGERGVRRSLTRAGLQLGALTHVVSDALSTLQGGSNARASAQNRMKALLNQDRALLSHRPYAQAALMDDAPEEAAPELPRKGSARTAAQNRMRELLNQDRAMLAFRAREGLDDDEDLDELLEYALRGQPSESSAQAAAGRSTCVGVTTSFVAEASVPSVCTPGPLPEAEAHVHAASTAFAAPVSVGAAPVSVGAAPASPVRAPATVGVGAASVGVGPASVSVASSPVTSAPASVGAAPASVSVAPASVGAASSPVASAPALVGVAASPAVAAVVPAVASPAAPAPKPSEAASAKGEESASDPIRTRGMAKLLALQGYRERALSIYDELIASEPNNAELRAEADKLRSN